MLFCLQKALDTSILYDRFSFFENLLYVSTKAIYSWQRAERLKQGIALKGLKPGESAEEGFKRLEKEMDELREANTILKKALGFMVGR